MFGGSIVPMIKIKNQTKINQNENQTKPIKLNLVGSVGYPI